MHKNQEFRSSVLAGYGASATEIEELLAYTENVFDHSHMPVASLPLPPEPHVATWEKYATQAQEIGVFQTLQSKLVQLRFPIIEGISQTTAYQSATRKGISVDEMTEATGLILQQPEKLQLIVHQSPAGAIPVIIAERPDFVSLVQALTMRNEPKEVPASMGACMVAGFNNWDRIHQYRQQLQQQHLDYTEASWNAEFQKIRTQKELYQDKFIILSQGAYSNVSASDVGLTQAEWLRLSLTIRLEHECTHYFTRRVFGEMRNNLLDEFIADYQGIVAAFGCYRDDWFLHFMGLELFPNYRPGGRLENYQGNLSHTSFKILQSLVVAAARNLKSFESQLTNPIHPTMMLTALCSLTLEEFASSEATAYLYQAMKKDMKFCGSKL